MSRSLVLKLLEAVPPQDLEGLKSICVRTVPTKPSKKAYKNWGALCGMRLHYNEEGTSGIRIFLYGITKNVLRNFKYGNSNLYDSFIEIFALVLYHEVGHHVHSKEEKYHILEGKYKKNIEKLQKLRKSKVDDYHPDDDISKIKNYLHSINNKFESFAEEYATKIISTSRSMNLLEAPQPKDILFFKIMRDKFVDSFFLSLNKYGINHSKLKTLAIFDHLRKCGLENGVKYNLREIFVEIYERQPERNELRRFKRFVLKHVTPFWYISKKGMQYAYFTENHLEVITSIHSLFPRARAHDLYI